MNAFFAIFIEQIITYVKEHIDEIIDALLKLLTGEPTDEVTKAEAALRANTTEATFNAFVESLSRAGVDKRAVATAVINEVVVEVAK